MIPRLPIISEYDSGFTDTVARPSKFSSGVNVSVRDVPVPTKSDNVPPVATKSSIEIVSVGSSLNVNFTVAVSLAFSTSSSIVTNTVGEVVSTVNVVLSVLTSLLLPTRSVIKLLIVYVASFKVSNGIDTEPLAISADTKLTSVVMMLSP